MAIFSLDDEDQSAPNTPALAGPTTSSSAPSGRAATAGSSGSNPTPGSAAGPNTTPGSGSNFVSAEQFMGENPGAGGGQPQGEMQAQLAGLKAAGEQAQSNVNQANQQLENNYQNTENQAYNAWQGNLNNEFQQNRNFWGKALNPTFEGTAFNPNTAAGTTVAPTLEAYTPPTGVTAGAEALKNEIQNPGMVGNPAQTTRGQALNNFLDLGAGEAEQNAPGVQTTAAQLEAGSPAPIATPYTAPNGGMPSAGVYQANRGANEGLSGIINGNPVDKTPPVNIFGWQLAFGGEVPGEAPVDGDSYKNDTKPLSVESGSVVLPRTVTMAPDAPDEAAKFVNRMHLRKFVQKGKR